jgi:phosphatidylserine/phosphatidylglycerophosphate/cardiolipin synthase-like enzyme
VELLVLPEDGVDPILRAIEGARRSIDINIFRCDRADVETALRAAVGRGVLVRTLIAHTNRGGTKRLRQMEHRLLAAGVTVCRTADDLDRYHGKPMVVDGKKLFVLGFNLTRLDIDKSRSFGVATTNRRLVREAMRLFEADASRQWYRPGHKDFVVSPFNSRQRLANFIRKARRQLWIYDPHVSDGPMLRLLQARARAGVDVRILGHIDKDVTGLRAQPYPGRRLHVRAMIRDRKRAFVGSQSLRRTELEARREVGVLFQHRRVVGRLLQIFEQDWACTELGRRMDADRLAS